MIRRCIGFCCLITASLAAGVVAAEPLHQRIDQAIRAGHKGPQAERSSDAEFLRRIWLDLAGTIPSSTDARQFLADSSADKRRKLIDRLLASPQYAQRMQYAFTVMLLERREGATVAMEDWNKFLRESFQQNKPLDELVREMLSADGTDPKNRPAMNFFLARSATDHKLLARDVSRLLLGRNLECAQCHNHPSIDDYKQSEFFGLVAFLDRSYLYRDKKTNESFFVDKGIGQKLAFTSVFTAETSKTGPRLVGGTELELPTFEKGQELQTPAAEGKPPVPKVSLRPKLAAQMTDPQFAAFKTNMANRLWALMLGRGLVHPLDRHHAKNPPSHPDVMKMLAGELVTRKFDVKHMLRELALSETYQRSSVIGDRADDVATQSFAAANMKSLSAEQLAFSVMQASGSLKSVLAASADKAATKKYRPDKGREMPAVNLDNVLKLFRSIYAARPGEPDTAFAPSLASALFVANEKLLLQWLTAKDGNLIDRLSKLQEATAVAEELYLTILTRLPTDEEQADVAEYLSKNSDGRETALREMAWALFASSEFRLNH